MPLKHARHNKDVFNFLRTSVSRFHDWEVTTAFYSALHFVNAELFPSSYENPVNGKIKNYHDFNLYYRDAKFADNESNKHSVLQDLVEEYMPEIRNDYRTLKDNCWTARYDNYDIDVDIADLALDCLENISEICEP